MDRHESALASATKRIACLVVKTEDLENHWRRKNIRMFGLKEGAGGKSPLLNFVHNILPQWLGLSPSKFFSLERVHCTQAPANPDQNRAVLIRFLKFQDKEFVLRFMRQRDIIHGGSKLTFAQDLSVETVQQRHEFNGAKELFLDTGAFQGFHLHPCKLKVLHQGKIHLLSLPQEAKEFYWKINAG